MEVKTDALGSGEETNPVSMITDCGTALDLLSEQKCSSVLWCRCRWWFLAVLPCTKFSAFGWAYQSKAFCHSTLLRSSNQVCYTNSRATGHTTTSSIILSFFRSKYSTKASPSRSPSLLQQILHLQHCYETRSHSFAICATTEPPPCRKSSP